MGRIHIPFRFGEPSNYHPSQIRSLARQVREMAIEADEPLPGSSKKLNIYNALKVFGGRFSRFSEEEVPLDQQLALEVWGPEDFILHETTHGLAGNNTLHCFALLGSYVLHYHQFSAEKWTAEDGSPIGMQWARFGESPRAMKDLAMREAYIFALEAVAPKSEMEAAIARFGEKDFWLAFHDNMRQSQAYKRARNLGLIAPAEKVPA